jgi:RNA polymerase sigma factor (sigma-70 family)
MSFDDYLAFGLGALLRFAAVVTCDPDLAEDVVRDVLVRAHGRWQRIAALEHPEAYLKRMVVDEYLSWRRRSSRVVPLARSTRLAVAQPRPAHATDHGERDATMRRIAALAPKQRAVAVLRYYEGLTDAQIADALGCSEAAVGTHAARALAALGSTVAHPARKKAETDDQ